MSITPVLIIVLAVVIGFGVDRLQLPQLVVDNVPPFGWRDYAGVDPRL